MTDADKKSEKSVPDAIPNHPPINSRQNHNNRFKVENVEKFSFNTKNVMNFRIENIHKEPIFMTEPNLNYQVPIIQDIFKKSNLEDEINIKNITDEPIKLLEMQEINKENFSTNNDMHAKQN